MDYGKLELIRKYGYDIIINRFEPLLRKTIMNEVLIIQHGLKNWKKQIPQGVIDALEEDDKIDCGSIDIEDFFEETYLWCLKDIAIYSDNFQHLRCLIEELSKDKFIELIDELNEIRHKIAHAKSTFTKLDLEKSIVIIKQICQGENGKELIKYVDNESYKLAEEIPPDFFEDVKCQNNLPTEDYDLDGGFVGRRKEINEIKKLLFSDQDRIITINGAGGVGKTAVALKTAYNLVFSRNNPYNSIIWFSAKDKKLTEQGIMSIKPGIEGHHQLIEDILKLIDFRTFDIFKKNDFEYSNYREHLYKVFSSQKCLLIIDNLETIKEDETIDFIKNVPRPSQVLITSRRGLGELERKYNLPDFDSKDALVLFRIIAKERNQRDLLKLENSNILTLLKKVEYYPLLIKWSIGKVCLGKEINDAFSEIYLGKSEIAEFVFDDIFNMFSDDAKSCLYSMIIFGDRPITKQMLIHTANLDEDSFEICIRELMVTSFVYPVFKEDTEGISSSYSMLSLTRGFVSHKLDSEKSILNKLQTRYFELSHQIQELEKTEMVYTQSLFSLGIKTPEEIIAFKYVKTAKNFARNDNFEEAEKSFMEAVKIAPYLIYALLEYAKFEFNRGRSDESNNLFQKAAKHEPQNYHIFFTYGICLRKQNDLDNAIPILKKAIELNPDHLPIYNELGRVLTFLGRYDEAEKYFEQARKQNRYPNYYHKFLTSLFLADNYRRWSEDFFKRKDIEGGILKLDLALQVVKVANTLKPGDKKALCLEKEVCKEIGKAYCTMGKFEKGKPYFEICFEKIKLISGNFLESDPEMAQAYYYYSFYGNKLKKLSTEEVIENIKKGLAIATDPKLIQNLNSLLSKVDTSYKEDELNRLIGTVEWFNKEKMYGVVSREKDTYTFLLRNFNEKLGQYEIDHLEDSVVSFILQERATKKGVKIATSINIEKQRTDRF